MKMMLLAISSKVSPSSQSLSLPRPPTKSSRSGGNWLAVIFPSCFSVFSSLTSASVDAAGWGLSGSGFGAFSDAGSTITSSLVASWSQTSSKLRDYSYWLTTCSSFSLDSCSSTISETSTFYAYSYIGAVDSWFTYVICSVSTSKGIVSVTLISLFIFFSCLALSSSSSLARDMSEVIFRLNASAIVTATSLLSRCC